MLVPCPLPWGGVGGGCQAPSLWEGWGGLLFVYRIIYPHTLCRRIAYPPERKGNTTCARACSLSKQSGERKANNNSAQGNALGEPMYQGYAPLGQNHLVSPHLVCVQLFFCPFRAFLLLHLCPQGVALGWRIVAPSGCWEPNVQADMLSA